MIATHDVLNQPPPFEDVDLFGADLALAEALEREGAGWAVDRVRDCGIAAGSAEAQEHGRRAERNAPRLRTHDRYGHRIDEVEYHPAWHRLMELSVGEGLHATPWASSDPHAHLRRAAGFYLTSQAEAGHGCPISMTYAVLPALRHSDELSARFEPGLGSTRPGNLPADQS